MAWGGAETAKISPEVWKRKPGTDLQFLTEKESAPG